VLPVTSLASCLQSSYSGRSSTSLHLSGNIQCHDRPVTRKHPCSPRAPFPCPLVTRKKRAITRKHNTHLPGTASWSLINDSEILTSCAPPPQHLLTRNRVLSAATNPKPVPSSQTSYPENTSRRHVPPLEGRDRPPSLPPPNNPTPTNPSNSPAAPEPRRIAAGKSRRRRAYPQQIVTTRLLYCLQDPFAHLSRLQRI
jgi:hypothetical protein